MNINNFFDKKIVVVISHQDDETLFCGGLLSEISNDSDITIVCVSKPYPNRPDTFTREQSLQNVCNHLHAKYIQLDFEDSGPENYPQNDFTNVKKKLHTLLDDLNPDMVITHNNVGEYGHVYHKFVHDIIVSIWKKHIIVFGIGLKSYDFEIHYNILNKKTLFDFYMPQWNGPKIYSFALEPEKYKTIKNR